MLTVYPIYLYISIHFIHNNSDHVAVKIEDQKLFYSNNYLHDYQVIINSNNTTIHDIYKVNIKSL